MNLRVSVESVDIAVISNVTFVFGFFLEESFNKKSSDFPLCSAVSPLDGSVVKVVARENRLSPMPPSGKKKATKKNEEQ